MTEETKEGGGSPSKPKLFQDDGDNDVRELLLLLAAVAVRELPFYSGEKTQVRALAAKIRRQMDVPDSSR